MRDGRDNRSNASVEEKCGKLDRGEKVRCHHYTVQPMQIDLEIVYSLWQGMKRVLSRHRTPDTSIEKS